jgi:hypothetical protein
MQEMDTSDGKKESTNMPCAALAMSQTKSPITMMRGFSDICRGDHIIRRS